MFIIGNFIDNAIGARRQGEEKQIQFNMRADQSTLLIKVENDFASTLIQKNGQYLTTKPDKNHHGMGLKSIQMIVDKNNGKMEIEVTDHKFSVVVMLYL